jgi:hypothetical protein
MIFVLEEPTGSLSLLIGSRLGQDEIEPQPRAGGQDHRPVDYVLELAHVARPIVPFQKFRISFGQTILETIQPATKVQHEMLCQSWNIFPGLAKRPENWGTSRLMIKGTAEFGGESAETGLGGGAE